MSTCVVRQHGVCSAREYCLGWLKLGGSRAFRISILRPSPNLTNLNVTASDRGAVLFRQADRGPATDKNAPNPSPLSLFVDVNWDPPDQAIKQLAMESKVIIIFWMFYLRPFGRPAAAEAVEHYSNSGYSHVQYPQTLVSQPGDPVTSAAIGILRHCPVPSHGIGIRPG